MHGAARAQAAAAAATPTNPRRLPVTLGVTEPFVTTFTVAGYAALLLALPFLLYQAYAFVLPAFSPRERRVALPLMLMVPVAVHRRRGVRLLRRAAARDRLPAELQRRQLRHPHAGHGLLPFSIVLIALIGLAVPDPGRRAGASRGWGSSRRAAAHNRGYVILAIAVVAAVATPTPDPVTMLMAMAPLSCCSSSASCSLGSSSAAARRPSRTTLGPRRRPVPT